LHVEHSSVASLSHQGDIACGFLAALAMMGNNKQFRFHSIDFGLMNVECGFFDWDFGLVIAD
jgi:hypothetical protein